jgi:hypothetical protein
VQPAWVDPGPAIPPLLEVLDAPDDAEAPDDPDAPDDVVPLDDALPGESSPELHALAALT